MGLEVRDHSQRELLENKDYWAQKNDTFCLSVCLFYKIADVSKSTRKQACSVRVGVEMAQPFWKQI